MVTIVQNFYIVAQFYLRINIMQLGTNKAINNPTSISVIPPCPRDQFQCVSGQCINATNRCDVKFDCDDKSDEERCGKYSSDKMQILKY